MLSNWTSPMPPGSFIVSRFRKALGPSLLPSTGRQIRRLRAVHHGSVVEGNEQSPMHQATAASCCDLKVIGIGSRGVSALRKLSGSFTSHLETELWAIDSDKKSLAGVSPSIKTIDVQQCDDTVLAAEELQKFGMALTPAQQKLQGPAPNQGVAFVLGSASGSPGGATLMLQVVNHLRRCGYFVGVALTRPFTFEGARKVEQADALIEAMEDVASLVVVIDQNVLTRASSELTMTEASAISDNTLEYTVRSLLWALRAPEILKATNGAFVWHGRDLRLMKRPLFPPMMHLITCPGVGNLGRGRAAIPASVVQQAGLPSALSTLAEDAVKAASESPFLEGKASCCTAALCVLLLPHSVMDASLMQDRLPGLNDNQREYALRSAIQVAALAVQEIAGPQCTDIIVCPQFRDEAEDASSLDAHEDTLHIECTLLMLQAIEEAAVSKGMASKPASSRPMPAPPNPMTRLNLSGSSAPRPVPDPARTGQASTGVRTVLGAGAGVSRSAGAAAPGAAVPVAASGVHVRNKTNWNAMSMIAGGSPVPAQGPQQQTRHVPLGSNMASAAGLLAARREAEQNKQRSAGLRMGQPAVPASAPRPALGSSSSSSPPEPVKGNGAYWDAAAAAIPRMADNLVASMVAQSLDLPPRAARWRHQQRHQTTATSGERSRNPVPGPTDATEKNALSSDEADKPGMDVRARVAGMLEKERDF